MRKENLWTKSKQWEGKDDQSQQNITNKKVTI